MFIIRTGPPYYNLVIDALTQKIPKQQVFTVGTDIDIAKEKVKYAPIFGAYYLIIAEYQKGKAFWQVVKELEDKKYVRLIVLTRTKEDFLTVAAKAEDSKFEFKLYDAYRASKKDKDLYIVKTLKSFNKDIVVPRSVLDEIRERLQGYNHEVNGYLQQLAWIPVTVANVRKVIPKKSMLTVASFGWMLYNKKISIADADALILRYRYYPVVLGDSLKKYTEKLITLYHPYIMGEFTEINYDEFITTHKKLVPSHYSAKTYLSIYERISIDRLYQIDCMLCEIGKSTRVNDILILYKVVRLIGGVL